MDASPSTSPRGESASGSETRFYTCRYCGNVVLRSEEPTRCFNCRTGHSTDELPESERDRVFRRLDEDELEELMFS